MIIKAEKKLEGGGFEVNRPFPTMALAQLDPFMLFDQMGPTELAPGEAKGAPDHPHRGFETVTYMLSGELEHRDSHGNHGVLGPGDVQWMTAGQGVIHSEMPTKNFQSSGGLMHGVQLWVNLPAKDKMMLPRYQDIPASRIPEVALIKGKVRVIAGEFQDTSAIIATRTPIEYLHFNLQGDSTRHAMPVGHNGMVYVLGGELRINGETLTGQQMLRLEPGEYELSGTCDALWLSGVPLNEPIARWGPFVMNTRDEIQAAMYDYQTGKFGTIPGKMQHGRKSVLVLSEVMAAKIRDLDLDVIVARDAELDIRKRPDILIISQDTPKSLQALATSTGVEMRMASLETIREVVS